MQRFNVTFLAYTVVLLVLNGCATTRPYKNGLPHNLEINTRIKSVKASMDIYDMGHQCKIDYLGTLTLNNGVLGVGLATERPVYLVVGFASSSFWSNSSSFTSYDVTLLPHRAFNYEADVSYIDKIYNVTFYEINRETGNRRELEGKELHLCRN